MYKKAVISLCIIMAIFISGCSEPSKKDLILENNALNSELVRAREDKKALEQTIKAFSKDGGAKAAISYIDSKSNKLTFNRLADKIVFTTPLDYPNSTQAPNNAKFSFNNNVHVTPTNNWLMVSDGTSLELNHVDGIAGSLRLTRIPKQVKDVDLQAHIEKFAEQLPRLKDADIIYGDIFLDNICCGKYVDAMTTVDGAEAIIRAGVVGSASMAILYIFSYDGARDKTKDELIDNIIKSLEINGLKVKYE